MEYLGATFDKKAVSKMTLKQFIVAYKTTLTSKNIDAKACFIAILGDKMTKAQRLSIS